MVLPDSHKISRVSWYLGAKPRESHLFAYWPFTIYGGVFQLLQLRCSFVTLRPVRILARLGPATPTVQRTRAYTRSVWAIPRSLAATEGIAVAFFS